MANQPELGNVVFGDLNINKNIFGYKYNRPEKLRKQIGQNKCCKPIFINGDWLGEIENDLRIKKPFPSYL